MFHIGVATQHPPLPEPGQLSEMGIDFIRQCLTIDPVQRPTAVELMDHPWMLDFREKLHSYEEAEKMAAGTLKITLMTALRFNRMNTTANRLEKKLYEDDELLAQVRKTNVETYAMKK